MHAILLSIGDELILGQTVDTNTAWLAQRLMNHGIRCLEHRTVDDGLDEIAQAISQAAAKAEYVIITGGIGPTDDDLTRQALAKAMGVELIEDPQSLRTLEDFFSKRGYPMSPQNRVQAMHPQTSTMVENTCGTAPGLKATLGQATIYVTPGVPREMKAMYTRSIEPELMASQQRHGRVILTTKINTFGCGESRVAERLGDLMSRDRNPVVGTTVADGLVSVRIRAEYEDAAQAKRELETTAQQVEHCLGALAFGRDDASLQETLIHELIARKQTIATAESCTGGMIAAMLTDVPGSSAVVQGGWVTYANAMKINQLGVCEKVLAEHGAVSEPVVRAMVEGALVRANSDLAVSTSGIAGPSGGTDEKPVGTVWIGLAWREDDRVVTDARCAHFPGSRSDVRDRSTKCAMQLLRLHVLGEDFSQLRWVK